MPLREGERAGEAHGPGSFIKSPLPRAGFARVSRRARRAPQNVRVHFKLSPDDLDWLEVRARSLKISCAALLRDLVEFYRSACTNRERELAEEITRIFPPGTNGISKPFAMASDALREKVS